MACSRRGASRRHTGVLPIAFLVLVLVNLDGFLSVQGFILKSAPSSITRPSFGRIASFSLDAHKASRPQGKRRKDSQVGNDEHPESKNPLKTLDYGSMHRRKALASVSASITAALLVSSLDLTAANAYDKNGFPMELYAADEEVDGKQRKVDKVYEAEFEFAQVSPLAIGPMSEPLGSFLWGSALWFLSGSRSTPIATPLANLVYDEKDTPWLKDRNDGLFADFPFPMYVLLAAVFVVAGFGLDSLVTTLGEGDRSISLQLAGVTLIAGGSYDLGRIANGEKKPTRDESDRDSQLQQEFVDFADSRLKFGGNCHRVDVIRAFRRYYAKYRQSDNPDYPLTDLELEQILRSWAAPLNGVDMSSAGFYTGIQVNDQADVFTRR
jgi:hypothetical protein